MKKKLQEMDDYMCRAKKSPFVRFVEREGPTLIDLVGRSNPCAKEWQCGQGDCAPCEGRLEIAAEEEREALAKVTGEG